jgi:membrane associated rhomboid family serine protease
MSPLSNPVEELKSFFRKGNALSVLIAINLLVWVAIKMLSVIFFLFNKPGSAASESFALRFLALPASISGLLSHPWTLATYMFFHLDFLHFLFNMLWFYMFGRIFLNYLRPKQLTFVYLFGGLAGGLTYVAAFNLFPVFRDQLDVSLALGASASVMAVVTAISFYIPNYSLQVPFIGRVKIIYPAIILFIFDFFAIPGGNSGGHLAHIGGAIFGFFWVMALTGSVGTQFSGIFAKLGRKLSGLFSSDKTKKRDQFTQTYTRPKTDDEFNAERASRQKRMDAILDKISKGGYDSLTKEEKEFLFRTTNKNK